MPRLRVRNKLEPILVSFFTKHKAKRTLRFSGMSTINFKDLLRSHQIIIWSSKSKWTEDLVNKMDQSGICLPLAAHLFQRKRILLIQILKFRVKTDRRSDSRVLRLRILPKIKEAQKTWCTTWTLINLVNHKGITKLLIPIFNAAIKFQFLNFKTANLKN